MTRFNGYRERKPYTPKPMVSWTSWLRGGMFTSPVYSPRSKKLLTKERSNSVKSHFYNINDVSTTMVKWFSKCLYYWTRELGTWLVSDRWNLKKNFLYKHHQFGDNKRINQWTTTYLELTCGRLKIFFTEERRNTDPFEFESLHTLLT